MSILSLAKFCEGIKLKYRCITHQYVIVSIPVHFTCIYHVLGGERMLFYSFHIVSRLLSLMEAIMEFMGDYMSANAGEGLAQFLLEVSITVRCACTVL